MRRSLSLTVVLLVVGVASADAQIVTNPVVTSWPPYTTVQRIAVPSGPPVAVEACTPPVVTFYAPSVSAPIVVAPAPSCCVPTTTYYAPAPSCYAAPIRAVAPTTAYNVPVTTYRVPVSSTYYVRAATVYPAPVTAYYSPIMNYRMPMPPTSSVFSAPAAAVPVTSYYAPAAPAAPVSSGRSCGCGGR